MTIYQKYLKYKKKYINLKGGDIHDNNFLYLLLSIDETDIQLEKIKKIFY